MGYDYGLTEEQRANLAKLADYLETQAKSETFGMREFYVVIDEDDDDGDFIPPDAPEAVEHPCGTVACAIGHGVSAGVPVIEGEYNWVDYANRAFGADIYHGGSEVWNTCFSPDWSRVDDTPTGAAARIRHVLAGGEPLTP